MSPTDLPVSRYSLDHVILLLDTPEFESLPKWLTENFTVIEGGTHADGSSRNKLVIFPDGSYIELINWITQPKEFFDWAGKAAGLIDFALTETKSAQETFGDVTRRLEQGGDGGGDGDGGLGVRYKPPSFGGRKRKDGQQVQWHVTKPLLDNDAPNVPRPAETFFPTGRLDTPFFCHDVTDRALRVPFADKDISETHPCGARGILAVEVLVPEEKLDNYAKLYASVVGVPPTANGGDQGVRFLLSTPNEEEPAMKALRGRVGVEIRAPQSQDDEAWLKERGVGIRRIRIFGEAKTRDEVGEGALDSEGIGASLVLVKEPVGSGHEAGR